MQSSIRHALLMMPLAWATASVQAGRPLATEDADILERGRCEWESVAARARATGSVSTRGWATQLGCGLGHDAQLALAYGSVRSAGLRADALTLLGKFGLVERSAGQLTGLALAWAVGGARSPGASFRHELTQLNLAASRTLTPVLTAHANLGWLRSEADRRNSTTWNLAAEYALDRRLDLTAEAFGDDRVRPSVAAGLRWNLSEGVGLNAAYSVQTDRPRVKAWSAGVKLSF